MEKILSVLQDAESLLLETPAVLLPRDHKAFGILISMMLYKKQRMLEETEDVYAVYLTDTELVFYTHSKIDEQSMFTEVSVLLTEIEALSSKIIALCAARDALSAAEKIHT